MTPTTVPTAQSSGDFTTAVLIAVAGVVALLAAWMLFLYLMRLGGRLVGTVLGGAVALLLRPLIGPVRWDYDTYIRSGRWRRKCRRYWATRGRWCHWPGCRVRAGLHVHHMTYCHLGRERLSELVGLCHAHHSQIHTLFDVHDPAALPAQRRFLASGAAPYPMREKVR